MSVSSGGGKVFGWFANLTSICGMITWTGICFTYLRFYAGLKAQGIDRKTLPFASRFQPYAAYFGFFSTIIICFVSRLSGRKCHQIRADSSPSLQFSGWTVFLPGRKSGMPEHSCSLLITYHHCRLGHGQLHNQLPSSGCVPGDLHQRSLLLQDPLGRSSGYGLHL